jgi:hypothetical protein
MDMPEMKILAARIEFIVLVVKKRITDVLRYIIQVMLLKEWGRELLFSLIAFAI